MISSPLLTELVRTLSNVPDPAGGLASTIRGVRVAESTLRCALDDLQGAATLVERQRCIVRRNTAMQELIVALQALHHLLEQSAN
jgi:hypothetical protein